MADYIQKNLRLHNERVNRRARRKAKKTRLYIDHEYITRGYCKAFKPQASLVYLVLAKYANYTSQSCYPSLDTIQAATGIGNRNTLVDIIGVLEEHRIISVGRSRGRVANIYTLLDSDSWAELPNGITRKG